jgi:hypothetical protein
MQNGTRSVFPAAQVCGILPDCKIDMMKSGVRGGAYAEDRLPIARFFLSRTGRTHWCAAGVRIVT